MDYGVLGAYFDGAVAKTLAGVDIMGANKSHQHEFNGVGPLRALFGDDDIKGMRTTFAYLDDGADPIFDHGYTTWYDARRKRPTRTEYRLYYNDNAAMGMARPGDLMVLALHEAKEVVILFARAGSTAESQVRWLFALDGVGEKGFTPSAREDTRITSIAARILESIGIEVSMPIAAENFLDGMIEKFGESFPKGADFSAYSASTLGKLDWTGDPDGCLVACYEREEMLFRVFERHLLGATSRHTLARRLMLMACCAPLCRPSSAASPVRGRRSRINSRCYSMLGAYATRRRNTPRANQSRISSFPLLTITTTPSSLSLD